MKIIFVAFAILLSLSLNAQIIKLNTNRNISKYTQAHLVSYYPGRGTVLKAKIENQIANIDASNISEGIYSLRLYKDSGEANTQFDIIISRKEPNLNIIWNHYSGRFEFDTATANYIWSQFQQRQSYYFDGQEAMKSFLSEYPHKGDDVFKYINERLKNFQDTLQILPKHYANSYRNHPILSKLFNLPDVEKTHLDYYWDSILPNFSFLAHSPFMPYAVNNYYNRINTEYVYKNEDVYQIFSSKLVNILSKTKEGYDYLANMADYIVFFSPIESHYHILTDQLLISERGKKDINLSKKSALFKNCKENDLIADTMLKRLGLSMPSNSPILYFYSTTCESCFEQLDKISNLPPEYQQHILGINTDMPSEFNQSIQSEYEKRTKKVSYKLKNDVVELITRFSLRGKPYFIRLEKESGGWRVKSRGTKIMQLG